MHVDGLSCGYDGKVVLKEINFQVGEGELWCILGPNGVGKTTLFKTILGLLPEKSGTVFLNNKKIRQWGRKEIAQKVAYVPQVHVPPFPFQSLEVVMMGRNPHLGSGRDVSSRDLDVALEAMELMGILHLQGVPYTEISGGERQLVLLARAIAQETALMIMDEPTSNLDFGNQVRVIEHIRKLVKMGKSIIMTSHFPENAFLPDCNVILLARDNYFRIGKGEEILTEDVLYHMYGVKNRIVQVENSKVCLPLYA